MPSLCSASHGKVLEIENLSPRITEIGNPRQTSLQGQFATYHMHGLRRACADDKVYRMLLEIVLKVSDRRPDPKTTWVRTEKISPYPHCSLLKEGLILSIYRIDLNRLLAMTGLLEKLSVKLVWLYDAGLDNLGRLRNLCLKRGVHSKLFWILRSIDYRLPALRREVFGEFHPSLHTGTSCRRPVIRYDKYPFHFILKDSKQRL